MRHHYTPTQRAKIKRLTTPCVDENVKKKQQKWNSLTLLVEDKIG